MDHYQEIQQSLSQSHPAQTGESSRLEPSVNDFDALEQQLPASGFSSNKGSVSASSSGISGDAMKRIREIQAGLQSSWQSAIQQRQGGETPRKSWASAIKPNIQPGQGHERKKTIIAPTEEIRGLDDIFPRPAETVLPVREEKKSQAVQNLPVSGYREVTPPPARKQEVACMTPSTPGSFSLAPMQTLLLLNALLGLRAQILAEVTTPAPALLATTATEAKPVAKRQADAAPVEKPMRASEMAHLKPRPNENVGFLLHRNKSLSTNIDTLAERYFTKAAEEDSRKEPLF